MIVKMLALRLELIFDAQLPSPYRAERTLPAGASGDPAPPFPTPVPADTTPGDSLQRRPS